MNPCRFVRLVLATFCLSLVGAGVFAQTGETDYPPGTALPGKDVGWLPTEQAVVDVMLDLAGVTPQDYVIDLGSGDGRIVITAAKRGARALGIEYNPDMVTLSKRNAAREDVSNRTEFIQADLFEVDFSEATVVTLFLRTDLNLKLRPRILNMKPGTRVVSNSFTMEEWTPDQSATLEEERCPNLCCAAYFWIVPAKVEGIWKLAEGELTFRQSFQMITGTISAGAACTPVTGRLRGNEISFTAGTARYAGRVNGNSMEGQVLSDEHTMNWTATRLTKESQVP